MLVPLDVPTQSRIPLELQEKIIAHASQENSDVSNQDIITTLQACSLVCTRWSHLTRRWIFRRVKLGISFSSARKPQPVSGGVEVDENTITLGFLAYMKANPTILDKIQSVHIRLARKTTSRTGLQTAFAKEAMGLVKEICAALAPNVKEVSLSFDSASLMQESPFLRDALASLYCGPRVHTVYMHNAMVPPSLILRSYSLRKVVLDQCCGVALPITIIEAVLLNRLIPNSSISNSGLSSLVIDNAQPGKMWSHLWRFLKEERNVDAFFSRIEDLSLSLSHSVPKIGPWDFNLYTPRLTSLTLSYISVEGKVVLPCLFQSAKYNLQIMFISRALSLTGSCTFRGVH